MQQSHVRPLPSLQSALDLVSCSVSLRRDWLTLPSRPSISPSLGKTQCSQPSPTPDLTPCSRTSASFSQALVTLLEVERRACLPCNLPRARSSHFSLTLLWPLVVKVGQRLEAPPRELGRVGHPDDGTRSPADRIQARTEGAVSSFFSREGQRETGRSRRRSRAWKLTTPYLLLFPSFPSLLWKQDDPVAPAEFATNSIFDNRQQRWL